MIAYRVWPVVAYLGFVGGAILLLYNGLRVVVDRHIKAVGLAAVGLLGVVVSLLIWGARW